MFPTDSGGWEGSASHFVCTDLCGDGNPCFGVRGENGFSTERGIDLDIINCEVTKMKNSKSILKLVTLAMLIALGVVISPILRVEGMCPMAHFINITCSVFLGPWYSLLCAVLIGVIRMMTMAIPPIALTGAVFGAFLSGVFYRLSKGKIIFAVLGEIIGTGIIGALVSYPLMRWFYGLDAQQWYYYVPFYTPSAVVGGAMGVAVLLILKRSGVLSRMLSELEN